MVKKLIGCGLPIFWSGAVSFAYPGVMSSYWQTRFDVGTEETGLVITFMLMALAATMFISGKIHMKIGMPRCIILGTVFYIVSFIIAMTAGNIYWIFVWGFVANVGSSLLYGPGLTEGQRALPERKGLISGILNMTFGFAAALMSPVFNIMLESWGYNFVNISLIVIFVITGLVSYCLVKSSEKVRKSGTAVAVSGDGSLSVKEALKTKRFWTLWLVWVLMGAAGISMVSLSKTYGIYLGLTGVAILTAFNFSNGIWRIIVGALMDKIGGRVAGVAAFGLAGVGYLILPHTQYLPLILICAAFVGIGFGTMFTISGPVCVELFGIKNFGMIYGLIFTAYGFVGGVLGPAVSGKILEVTGNSYSLVFTYLGIMAIGGAILMFFVRKKPAEAETEEKIL